MNFCSGDTQVCAGQEGKDACRGDSGGPMMLQDQTGRMSIFGVTSFGPTPCGNSKLPGVFTRVDKYLSWIETII